MVVEEFSMRGLSKPVVNRRDFTNLDELVSLINQTRNYNVYPLSRDSFHYHFTQIDFGAIKFIKTKVYSPVHLVGDRLKDWREFIVYLNYPSQLIWNDYIPLSYQHLFGFANHRQADFIFPSNLIIGAFRIQETYFQQYLKTMNYLDIDLDFLSRDYALLPTTLQPVQAYLRDLFCLTDTFPELLTHDHLQKLILEDFIPLFIQAIASASKTPPPLIAPRYRHQLVKEVRDYMMNHLGEPITLKTICQNVYASTRSINYGFQEVFGISPMSYLKILRLYGVRQALKKAEPTENQVKEIAKHFGFWSMGHFTRDYKLFFGELPSVTLGQTRRETDIYA